MELQREILDIDGEGLVAEYALRDKNVVFLHGAGQAQHRRYYPIAQELLSRGIGVVLFDFSGHGESSGQLAELSLDRRETQAAAVIDRLIPRGSSLYLFGSSMSGQTLCDLLPRYGDKVEAIVLACPAIYAAEVHDLQFGNPEFTRILRTPDSWQTSRAPAALGAFVGNTIIAIGSEDEVIPPGVTQLLKSAARDSVFIEYKGVKHGLTAWLGEHPKERIALIDQFLA